MTNTYTNCALGICKEKSNYIQLWIWHIRNQKVFITVSKKTASILPRPFMTSNSLIKWIVFICDFCLQSEAYRTQCVVLSRSHRVKGWKSEDSRVLASLFILLFNSSLCSKSATIFPERIFFLHSKNWALKQKFWKYDLLLTEAYLKCTVNNNP